jgi:hypothetical protein
MVVTDHWRRARQLDVKSAAAEVRGDGSLNQAFIFVNVNGDF